MARTYTETVGMVKGVIAHLGDADNATALTAKGFDVANRKARLEGKLEKMTKDNAEQEKRKVALTEQTKVLDGSVEAGYNDASGAIDALADAYGKGSDAAKNVQKIRSAIRHGSHPSQPTPPTP